MQHHSRPARRVEKIRAEAVSYYRLCDEAEAFGIPTSLDDPRSPKTVPALRAAVEAERGKP